MSFREVGRRKPAQGVKIELGQATILFVTVCAVRPAKWLATEVVHESLVRIWSEADGWLVGDYVLMPDHVHLFCGRGICNLRWRSGWSFGRGSFRASIEMGNGFGSDRVFIIG